MKRIVLETVGIFVMYAIAALLNLALRLMDWPTKTRFITWHETFCTMLRMQISWKFSVSVPKRLSTVNRISSSRAGTVL